MEMTYPRYHVHSQLVPILIIGSSFTPRWLTLCYSEHNLSFLSFLLRWLTLGVRVRVGKSVCIYSNAMCVKQWVVDYFSSSGFKIWVYERVPIFVLYMYCLVLVWKKELSILWIVVREKNVVNYWSVLPVKNLGIYVWLYLSSEKPHCLIYLFRIENHVILGSFECYVLLKASNNLTLKYGSYFMVWDVMFK